jgi:Alcohol acetyltransferase
VGKPRSETYELSNVGALKNVVENEKWRIQRVIFTQSAMATGPAIGFNIASIAGGPLTIILSLLEGDIDESLVDELIKDVERGLRSIAEGREVTQSMK